MPGQVYTVGLTELNRALRQIDRSAQRELQKELRRVAEPVAADARSRAVRFGPKTEKGIRAGSSRGQAVVRQRVRATTHLRPDFGVLQMRTVLLPALYDNEKEIIAGLEEMLDRLAADNGF